MKAIILPVESAPYLQDLSPTLDSMQAAIEGGWLECIQLDKDTELYCDEEGKLKNLPPNATATLVARTPIVGQAFLVGKAGPEGNNTDVSSWWIGLMMRGEKECEVQA